MNYKKVFFLAISLILAYNSTSAISPADYLDVYTMSSYESYVNFQIKPGSNPILNKFITAYSNQDMQVYLANNWLLNGSSRVLFEIKRNQVVTIVTKSQNLTFWAERISETDLHEIDELVDRSLVQTAHDMGMLEVIIAVFVFSPIVSIIFRRSRL